MDDAGEVMRVQRGDEPVAGVDADACRDRVPLAADHDVEMLMGVEHLALGLERWDPDLDEASPERRPIVRRPWSLRRHQARQSGRPARRRRRGHGKREDGNAQQSAKPHP